MIEIYNYTIITNADIDKKYINKIDAAILYNSNNDNYFPGIIYYDDIDSDPSLIIGLDKHIYLINKKSYLEDIKYLNYFIDKNIEYLKDIINNDAQDLIYNNEFEKL